MQKFRVYPNHFFHDGPLDLTFPDEWDVEMGTPEKVRAAIAEVEIDDDEVRALLIADLDELQGTEQ